MQATLDRRIYRLSVDCVLDAASRVWEAREVTLETHGQLSLMLDTNPIEDRIYCYTTDVGWRACNSRGSDVVIKDENILTYLAEIRQAVLGGQA